jgi:prepilin-type N-terminal cleavage/methylation domain-containing protein
MKTGTFFEGPHRHRTGAEGPTPRKSEGFTIIELIVVVAILAIIAAIAIPSFQRYAVNGNLRSAARDIISDFNALKGRAVAENQEYRLAINGNQYTIQRCTDSTSPCGTWGPPPADMASLKSPASFSGDIVMSPNATYTFQTRGIVTPAGTIGFTNSRGSTATVTVNTAGKTSAQFNMR